MRVRVHIAFDCELPSKSAEREKLYGTVDPGACVLMDLENDPASFLMDNSSEVSKIEVLAPEGRRAGR